MDWFLKFSLKKVNNVSHEKYLINNDSEFINTTAI